MCSVLVISARRRAFKMFLFIFELFFYKQIKSSNAIIRKEQKNRSLTNYRVNCWWDRMYMWWVGLTRVNDFERRWKINIYVIIWCLVWPMEYMKTQLQLLKPVAGVKPPFTGVIDGLTYTVKTTGFLSLYRGLSVTLAGSIPKAGIRLVVFRRSYINKLHLICFDQIDSAVIRIANSS